MLKRVFVSCIIVLTLTLSGVVVAADLTFEELIANVEKQINQLENFEVTIELKLMDQGLSDTMVVKVISSLEHGLFRMEMLAPSEIAGQIFIVDSENNIAKIYMPLIEHIIIQSLDSAAAGYGMDLDFGDFELFADFSNVEGEIHEVITTETGKEYVVKIPNLDTSLFTIDTPSGQSHEYVSINSDFIPYKIKSYDQDILFAQIMLTDYQLNPDLTPEMINELPDVPVLEF